MKEINKICKTIIVLFIMFMGFSVNLIAQTGVTPVFDSMSWLAEIENLYSTYDNVTNSLKMIQQNYEKMQHAIEEAKNLDWENIEWDGDFDFRNELTDVSAQVNRRLDRIRKAETFFTKEQINFGGQKFSLTDLMTVEGRQNVSNAFKDANTNSYTKARDIWVNGLTAKQKRKIWRKYHVNPKTYYSVKIKEAMVQKAQVDIISKAQGELLNEEMIENQERINEVMKKIMKGGTNKELAQYTALLQQLTAEKMDLLKQQAAEVAAAEQKKEMFEEKEKLEDETKTAIIDNMSSDPTRMLGFSNDFGLDKTPKTKEELDAEEASEEEELDSIADPVLN